MKSKVNVKSNYSIKKVNRVLRMKSENFEPTTFEVFKVTGPKGFKKFFSSRKDANEYIKQHTDTKMSVADVFKEIKRINDIKLPIKTIQ
jgi:hypothetical protein